MWLYYELNFWSPVSSVSWDFMRKSADWILTAVYRKVGLAIWISLKPWHCFSASCSHLHVDLWLPGDRCVRGKHLPGRPEVAPRQRLSGSGSVQGLHSGAHGITGRDGGEVRARVSKHARQTTRWTNGKPRWGQVTGLDVTSASEHEDICIFQGWAVSRSSHAFDDSSQRGRRAFYLLRRLKYHSPIFQARLQRDTHKDSKVKSSNLDWSRFNLERPVWRMTPPHHPPVIASVWMFLEGFVVSLWMMCSRKKKRRKKKNAQCAYFRLRAKSEVVNVIVDPGSLWAYKT